MSKFYVALRLGAEGGGVILCTISVMLPSVGLWKLSANTFTISLHTICSGLLRGYPHRTRDCPELEVMCNIYFGCYVLIKVVFFKSTC